MSVGCKNGHIAGGDFHAGVAFAGLVRFVREQKRQRLEEA